jgi:hypothetical protein
LIISFEVLAMLQPVAENGSLVDPRRKSAMAKLLWLEIL